MKRKILISLGALSAGAMLLKPKKASAWFSDTHSAIFENALEILKNDNKTDAYEFYKTNQDRIAYGVIAVSYTHLTLPTICSV